MGDLSPLAGITTLRTLARRGLGPFREGGVVLTDSVPRCDEEPLAQARVAAGGTAAANAAWRVSGRLPDLVLDLAAPRDLCGLRLVLEVGSPGHRRSRATVRFTASPPDGGEGEHRSVELKFGGSGTFVRTVWVYGVVRQLAMRVDPGVTELRISSVTLLTPSRNR